MPKQSRLIAFGHPEEAALASWRQTHDTGLRSRPRAHADSIANHRGNGLRREVVASALLLLIRVVAAVAVGTLTLCLLAQCGYIDNPAVDYRPMGGR